MKFIGHLDIMRYFQKCMRRADIDIRYSEGFSPHQIMSFAAPLGVGITSEGEYLDIEVHSTRSSQESVLALNEVMVEGMKVLEYKKLPDTAKTSMALVAAADYRIYKKPTANTAEYISARIEDISARIEEFLQQDEILIVKQTKKSEITMDLKPLIYEMKWEDGFFLKVCTGSKVNVKPELVLEAFFKFCGSEFEPLEWQIHRLELYADAQEIPVKGEKEREAYEAYLNSLKEDFKAQGKEFPQFVALGELGEEISGI